MTEANESAQASQKAAEAAQDAAQASQKAAEAAQQGVAGMAHTARAAQGAAQAGQKAAEATERGVAGMADTATAARESAQASQKAAEATQQGVAGMAYTAKAAKDAAQAGQKAAEATEKGVVGMADTAKAAQDAAQASQKAAEATERGVAGMADAATAARDAAQASAEAAKAALAAADTAQTVTSTLADSLTAVKDATQAAKESAALVSESVDHMDRSVDLLRQAVETWLEAPPDEPESFLGLPIRAALVAAILFLALVVLCLSATLLFNRPRPVEPSMTPAPTATLPPDGTPAAWINVSTGADHIFHPGDDVPLQLWSSAGGLLSVSAFDPFGNRQVVFPDLPIKSGQTIKQDWPCPGEPGPWLVAADLNQGAASAACDLTVESVAQVDSGPYEVIYDLVAKASQATWSFYYSAAVTPEPYATASAHGENYTMGRAAILQNQTLENKESDPEVLLTNPPWIAQGMVMGRYNIGHLEIEDGDYVFVKIGFLDGSYRGDAFFHVILQAAQSGSDTQLPPVIAPASTRSRIGGLGPGVITMISARDQSDPTGEEERLKSFVAPLPTDVPVAYLYLVVDNGSTAYLDRAVWVDAEIRRPLD